MGKYQLAILIGLFVLVLLVGGKKLPELARGVGEAGKELKKGFNSKDDDEEEKKKTTKK